jgi:hypothetical protein
VRDSIIYQTVAQVGFNHPSNPVNHSHPVILSKNPLFVSWLWYLVFGHSFVICALVICHSALLGPFSPCFPLKTLLYLFRCLRRPTWLTRTPVGTGLLIIPEKIESHRRALVPSFAGSDAMKTQSPFAELWTAAHRSLSADGFSFSISAPAAFLPIPERISAKNGNAKSAKKHNTHTIKTHYHTIILPGNPHPTLVISGSYDFFYRNTHPKKFNSDTHRVLSRLSERGQPCPPRIVSLPQRILIAPKDKQKISQTKLHC